MKLSECIIGTPVVYQNSSYEKDTEFHMKNMVGHIVGFTYNVHVSMTGNFSSKERLERTSPLVQWVNGDKYGIHHGNIRILKGI